MKKLILLLITTSILFANSYLAPLKTKNLIYTLKQKNNYAGISYVYGSIENMDKSNICFDTNIDIDYIIISILVYEKNKKNPAPLAKNFLQNALIFLFPCVDK